MEKSFLDNHVVRGLRNNNPGNLIITKATWLGKIKNGKDERFEQFVNIRYGLRALMVNLRTNVKNGHNTVRKLIVKYAPSFENDTKGYINSVAKKMGIGADVKLSLSKSQLIDLAKAITVVELGSYSGQLVASDYENAYAVLSDKTATYVEKITGYLPVIIPVVLFFYTIGTLCL